MPEDRRERLLGLARAAREFPGALRRRAIADLIHERYRQEREAAFRGDAPDITVTVEEVVLCAYATANAYWGAWLHDPLPPGELVARLAEVSATSETDLLRRTQLLQEVVAKCPLDLAHSTARDVARWLIEHPDSDGLLPPSLLAYLLPAAEPTAPAPTTGSASAPPAAAAAEPTPEAQLQARYDARLTETHVPTIEEDRIWATQQGVLQKEVEALRRNNPDPRLHTRGRRQR
jgi:hypothetical protein